MAVINFDQEQRRDTKEPQTTKTELLRPPPATNSAFAADSTTSRSAAGLTDLYSSSSTWNFNAIGANATPSLNEIAQVKQEMATPVPERGNHKRQRSPTDSSHEPLSKKAKARARQTSDERFGRKTGVIDLTLDDSSSDDDDGQPFPERQFVPGANDEPGITRSGRRTMQSPPRTFTRDLSPIAAHSRKAPIVHRSKPPIKPENRRQTPMTSSSPAPISRPVFNRMLRPLAPARNNTVSQSSTSITRSTPSSQRALVGLSTANSSTTLIRNKTDGLFIDDDDSSEEELSTKTHGRAVPRTSMVRLIDRPRFDTPKRTALSDMQEESRAMRERAHERLLGEAGGHASSPSAVDCAPVIVDQLLVSTQSSQNQSFLGVPRPR